MLSPLSASNFTSATRKPQNDGKLDTAALSGFENTESLVTDIPTPPAPVAAPGPDMGGMY